ncbi:MAG TPA: ion channel [Ignavibacteria bacterium]|jgi:hypothetical protein
MTIITDKTILVNELRAISKSLEDTIKFLDEHFNFYLIKDNKESSNKRELCEILFSELTKLIGTLIEGYDDEKQIMKAFYKFEIYVILLHQEKIIDYADFLRYFHGYILFSSIVHEYNYGLLKCYDLIRIFNEKKKELKRNLNINEYLHCLEMNLGAIKFGKVMSQNAGLDNSYFSYWEKDLIKRIYVRGYDVSDILMVLKKPSYVSTGGKMLHAFTRSEPKLFEKMWIYFKGITWHILKYTVGYGEKPFRLLITSFIFIFTFGFAYYYFNLIESKDFFNNLYFSLLTFATFGFSENNSNAKLIFKIIVSLEVLLGLLCINSYIVVLAKKLFR